MTPQLNGVSERLNQTLLDMIKRKLPKVNRTLASRLLEEDEKLDDQKGTDNIDTLKVPDKKTSKKKKGLTSEVLKDERFTPMFENKDFVVDEFSQEYLALHPMAAPTKKPSLFDEHFETLAEEDGQSISGSDVPSGSESSEDEQTNSNTKSMKKSRVPRFYEVKDNRHAEAFRNRESLGQEDSLPLGERLALRKQREDVPKGFVKHGQGGSREISFNPRSLKKYMESDEDDEGRPGRRRGVQSLKLPGLGVHGGGGRSGGRRGGFRGRNNRGRGRR
ncbi:uncharacterized protein [Henckelia pumila]|uniref:uncharacterized protein n=1 Tax=Henckelia pumila TaxID=405737 RepID=UPI003C6DD0BB